MNNDQILGLIVLLSAIWVRLGVAVEARKTRRAFEDVARAYLKETP